MSYIAICMLGVVAYFQLPVSLMPDIAIPEITVRASYPNSPAGEMENAIVKNLRRQLLQVTHLKDIQSETRTGSSIIKLRFEYGTDINYAFIETNEKIDAAMNILPRDMERPKVIKASATDIPVFYLNVSLEKHSENKFRELSNFCENVIKRHIEQLPEVAMADLSGRTSHQVVIMPDKQKLAALSLTNNHISAALAENNIEPGNLLIRDGQYQYHVRFSSVLNTRTDIENMFLYAGNKVIQLKDIASVTITDEKLRGMCTSGNKRAITMAVIKQANARMSEMKDKLQTLVDYFTASYPELAFEVAQDQTRLLDYSINNLQNTLVISLILVFIIMLVFLKNIQSAILVGLIIPVSVIISLLFFMLFGLTINIISLSGLILAVGMMIDNSIIVTDNINQHFERVQDLEQACIKGTNEVIRPLLSSALTTSAIFLPLIFLSGISGALFFDQAVTVTTGLGVSFALSITLLPALYFLFSKKQSQKGTIKVKTNTFFSGFLNFENSYERGFEFVFRKKKLSLTTFLVLVPVAIVLFQNLDKEKLPSFEQTELVVYIDWNQNIRITENYKKTWRLFKDIDSLIIQKNSLIGEQQFLLNKENNMTMSETKIYIRAGNNASTGTIKNHVSDYMMRHFPRAKIRIQAPQTIFEKMFSPDESPLIAEISLKNKDLQIDPYQINTLADSLDNKTNNTIKNKIPIEEYLSIDVDHEKLMIYHVAYNDLVNALKTSFNEHRIGILKASQNFIPVMLGEKERPVSEILNTLYVENGKGEHIPVKALIKTSRKQTMKTITAGKEGRYVGLNFKTPNDGYPFLMNQIQQIIKNFNSYVVSFSGSFFSQKILMNELLVVLGVSLLLLYFILAAQFESLIQPVIVLLEIPIDISGALFMLWLFDASVNIMAMIGIVVMSGIIINDSILKIDTINRLTNEMNLIDAIKTGGHRRIRPIIMTSLTTICALLPFLFGAGMGSELQLPLALTVIGGMTIGTIVSLYFIPLAYWFIYSKFQK